MTFVEFPGRRLQTSCLSACRAHRRADAGIYHLFLPDGTDKYRQPSLTSVRSAKIRAAQSPPRTTTHLGPAGAPQTMSAAPLG